MPRNMILHRFCLTAILAASLAGTALAETIEVGPNGSWFKTLSSDHLQPGDEVVLRQGIYSDARRLVIRHSGTAGKPITIRAAKGETVVFRRPDAGQNTINLDGNQYLRLIGFEITGGSSAIRIGPHEDRQPSDIVLESLHIHDIGGIAVTCNHTDGQYKRMTFRGNHIHHTAGHGEAFYLGGNNATAIISESIIENNYIHHLNGGKVSQGDGIEIKQGSYGNRIIGNVIHDTKYPGITVYGTAGQAQNVIENNLIFNTGDHGIQAAADAIIRNNYIANAAGCGLYSREHQGAIPGNLRIEGNYVIAGKNPALRIIGPPAADANSNIKLIDNRLFAGNGHPAIRIDNKVAISAHQNSGQGGAVGSDQASNQWTTTSKPNHVDLPKLSGHIAWKHLDREVVEAKFIELR